MMAGLNRTRFLLYVSGNLILTLGVVLTIFSNVGTSPFDALLVGLSENIGLTVGSWEIILAFIMIGCNALLAKQRPEFSGLLTALITGLGIDLWLFLLHPVIQPEQFPAQLACLIAGLIVIGLGTAVYLHANLAANPVDRLMLIIRELTGKSIFFSKTVIYLFFLAMAFLFQGPIGFGTVLTVCLGGPILNFFMKWMDALVNKSSLPSIHTEIELDKNHSI